MQQSKEIKSIGKRRTTEGTRDEKRTIGRDADAEEGVFWLGCLFRQNVVDQPGCIDKRRERE